MVTRKSTWPRRPWVPVLRQDGTLARQRWWFPALPSAGADSLRCARCERALASPLYRPWLHIVVHPFRPDFMEWWQPPDGRRLPWRFGPPLGPYT